MLNKNKIGIIGAGTMGNGIAHVFSLCGYETMLIDINKVVLEQALNNIKSNMQRQIKKNIINESEMSIAISKIKTSTNMNNLKNCFIVIEAIKEDVTIKGSLFKELDTLCHEETILASNTSSISIDTLSKNTERRDKVIGMHFMNPVPMMKLVEIVKGTITSKETLETIIAVSKLIKKIPITCNDSPGFVSNRILMPMINEAAHCYYEKVADANSIDQIMKLGLGHPLGPLKLADLIGIDVCVFIMNILYEDFNNEKYKPCLIFDQMLKENKLGKKNGEGFYKYEF